MPREIPISAVSNVSADLKDIIDTSINNDTFSILSSDFLADSLIFHETENLDDLGYIEMCIDRIAARIRILQEISAENCDIFAQKNFDFSDTKKFLKTLSEADLKLLVDIFDSLQNNDYTAARNLELEFSVGCSNWLIGVYRTGHHDSSERSELNPDKIQHKAKDEFVKRWLKSINFIVSSFPNL